MTTLLFHVSQIAVVSADCADIASWQTWARSDKESVPTGLPPDYAFLSAGVRRRLSPMGRCALSAYAALKPKNTEPTIWASSWGDISRTFKLTRSLAESNEMSPADFALSVHNAIGAQAAIWLKNHTSTTALAAGNLTASSALIETYLKLRHSPSVILVRYEEALPELWNREDTYDASSLTCAWAVRLTAQKSDYSFTLSPCNSPRVGTECNILSEIRFLLGGVASYRESNDQCGWLWERP